MKKDETSCQGEREDFDVGQKLVHLHPVKVATPTEEGLHRWDEDGSVFHSENQPSKEHEKLSDQPRENDAPPAER